MVLIVYRLGHSLNMPVHIPHGQGAWPHIVPYFTRLNSEGSAGLCFLADATSTETNPMCLHNLSTLVSVEISYRDKPTLYLSQIKPHMTIISEVSREKSQKRLSVQVVRLSAKVCYLHLYTIKLLLFSYIYAKFEVRKRAKIRNHQWESNKLTIRHHKREPRGQPFPSRWPQGNNKQTRTKT